MNQTLKLCPGTIKILEKSKYGTVGKSTIKSKDVGERLYKRGKESLERKKENFITN